MGIPDNGSPAPHGRPHPLHELVEKIRDLLHRVTINSERQYRGAPAWSADTFVLAATSEAKRILSTNPGRRYAVIANPGANPASFGPSRSVSPGGPGTFTLAAGAVPRRIDTTAEVYAVSTAGTTVDVMTVNDPDD